MPTSPPANVAEHRQRSVWPLVPRIFAYSKPYYWRLAGVLAMIAATTSLQITTPFIQRSLIDQVIPSGQMARLVPLALALLLIPLASGGLTLAQRRVHAAVGEGIVYDLRVALFDRLHQMSLHFYSNTKAGELISRLNNDVTGAQMAVGNAMLSGASNVVSAVACACVMFSLEWRLAACSVLILPLLLLAVRHLGARLRDVARRGMSANAEMNALMNETLSLNGALLVRLFGQRVAEVKRFASLAASVRAVAVERVVVTMVFFVLIGLIGGIGTALVYGVGGYMAIRGAFTVGTIVAFGSCLMMLYGSLSALSNVPAELSAAVVSFERVFEVLDLPRETEVGQRQLTEVCGDLVFDDVSFKYTIDRTRLLKPAPRPEAALSGDDPNVHSGGDPHPSVEDYALRNVSFCARPGQVVAVVGPSGAGKTTLGYLVTRLYEPSEGRVLLDGHDLREIAIESLVRHVGVVTQETFLLHDTARANLSYGRPSAGEDELVAAAKAAGIHGVLITLPQGYDTVVGERGYRLSGGEKQRLALARVILKSPRILILDEATSHLDAESEALIQEALKRVMVGRTSIVIAHRLSTVLAADLILVLDRGRVVESGTHKELLAQHGLYASLFETLLVGRSGPAESKTGSA